MHKRSSAYFLVAALLLAITMSAMGTGSGGWPGPISTTEPSFVKSPHPLQPNSLVGSLQAPHPTNAWWGNLLLDDGTYSVAPLPYLMTATQRGLAVSMPSLVASNISVLSIFLEDLIFQAAENFTKRYVTEYDELSVGVKFEGNGGSMQVPIVRGMAYATAIYNALTPSFASRNALTAINGNNPAPGTDFTGTKFKIEFNSGQTWLLYSSASITLTFVGNTGSSRLVAKSKFSGTLRAAVLPSGATTTAETVFDTYCNCYPTSGSLSLSASGNTGTIGFNFATSGSGDLLMLSLPHHRDCLQSPKTETSITYVTIRGKMQGIVGKQWTMTERLTTTSWTAPRSIPAGSQAQIIAALTADAAAVTTPQISDPYFFGKAIAKYARLVLIAEELGQTTIASTIRSQLKTYISPWLDGTNNNPFKYETTWKGICTTNGLADRGSDFGGGWYNDHHFHYGYFLYTAAVIAKGDSQWAQQYSDKLAHLARDFANPSSADTWFPTFRMKDWFEGHSWAGGLFAFGDGRNQESTSEAVNAYYGLYLYGLSIGNQNLKDLGRIMLAAEIRSAQKYWQITASGDIYPSIFAANKVVGIVWNNKVDYATWFGPNPEFIHCIQMLPFTPITEEFLPRTWIQEEYPVLLRRIQQSSTQPTQAWMGYVYMAHAIVDKTTATTEVNTLTAYDDGNTKTNTLWWVASRAALAYDGTPK